MTNKYINNKRLTIALLQIYYLTNTFLTVIQFFLKYHNIGFIVINYQSCVQQ